MASNASYPSSGGSRGYHDPRNRNIPYPTIAYVKTAPRELYEMSNEMLALAART